MPRSRCGLANRFIDVLLTLRYTNEKTHELQLKSIGYVVGKTASSKLNYFTLINHTHNWLKAHSLYMSELVKPSFQRDIKHVVEAV